MPPHVASPARLFARAVDDGIRRWSSTTIEVRCGGATHHLRFDGGALYAADHDEAAEAVVGSLGGPVPVCIRLVTAASEADVATWWASLAVAAAGAAEPLSALPDDVRRLLLARSLRDEFADAATPVRDSVAQLGLALLGSPPPPIAGLRVKFQMTRELPHWETGPGPWSDKELVLLHRCFRSAPGEERPHLVRLPIDPLARTAVARYVGELLDPARVLTMDELRTVLSPTHRNVRALVALLVAEGVLAATDGGGYRVARRR